MFMFWKIKSEGRDTCGVTSCQPHEFGLKLNLIVMQSCNHVLVIYYLGADRILFKQDG